MEANGQRLLFRSVFLLLSVFFGKRGKYLKSDGTNLEAHFLLLVLISVLV
jgi:hypothetical protein